jgi:uroporphyrinogen-III synthase
MRPLYLFSTSKHSQAISINSLSIKFFKPSFLVNKYDYFIITSKQISEVFKSFNIIPSLPALCVSEKTAEAYEEIGGTVLSVGGGYGDNLERIIKKYPKEKRWLYLRAKVVASDFVQRCKDDGYKIDDEIVYESFCSNEILEVEIKEEASLIFTSPSSVECFLKKHSFNSKHKVIVIGKTTAKRLPKEVKYIQSDKTTIQSCIDLSYSMEENRDIFV